MKLSHQNPILLVDGLAVAIESLEALIEHLTLEQSGAKCEFNELFRTKANEIFN